MQQKILVYVDLKGISHRVGTLWTRYQRGRESASFEYTASWLAHSERFALEPALSLVSGAMHTEVGRALFGAVGDSAPDRWGRVLIQREERRKAKLENRAPRTLGESDYLLGVGDATRQGALRFALEEGEFLAPQTEHSIPPLIRLNKLLYAANRLETDAEEDEDLQLLLAPASSLGGARAKASVIDQQGDLAIAKFPQLQDDWLVTTWEMVALDLAEESGIYVPLHRLESIGEKQVLVVKRFDRNRNIRIPFLSAMSMLTTKDNQTHSYLEIVDAIRLYGSAPDQDLKQLWRRIIFSILIANTDDHLRNHGFLYDGKGWRLSPAYDLNPTPTDVKQRFLSLAIDEEDNTASLEVAYKVASEFGLKIKIAQEIVSEVTQVVSKWREIALKYKLSPKEIERMSPAFEYSKDMIK
jgi:serine/threonine-protein kinase HipA